MGIQTKIWIGFTISWLILSAGVFAGHQAIQQLIDRTSWVEHTYKVGMLVESISSQLKDAETGQRGYLLTDQLTYLEPYENGISKLRNTLRNAKELTIDNPRQQERINQLEILTNKKLVELKETIDLNKEGNRAEALRIILTNRGKQLMNDIRTIIQEMHDEERELLLVRQQESQSAVNSASLLILFGSVLTFVTLGTIAIFIGRTSEHYMIEREQSEANLIHLATHDNLTGLYNRIALDQRLDDEIQRASRYKSPLSIFMVDIDNFKSINDTYGHHIGDMALRHLAKILKLLVRKMDYVARYGGEEFIVICPETPLLKAQELAERIRILVSEYPFHIEDNYKLNLTVSIGVATFPEHANSLQALMKVADASMYAAKQSGRNQIKTP